MRHNGNNATVARISPLTAHTCASILLLLVRNIVVILLRSNGEVTAHLRRYIEPFAFFHAGLGERLGGPLGHPQF